MTKADIIDKIATETGMSKTDVSVVLSGFLSSVKTALAQKERVEIRGFGVFKLVKQAPRKGRNLKTGESIKIPERYVPAFKPSEKLKSNIEEQL